MRKPSVVAVSVLSLGLGIGVATTVATVVAILAIYEGGISVTKNARNREPAIAGARAARA